MSLIRDTLWRIAGAAGKAVRPAPGETDAAASGNFDLAVFSYKEDFTALWDAVAGQEDPAATVVVVWDGIPGGGTGLVSTSRYLTPLDWAAAFALARGNGQPEILIFDLASHEVPDADVLRMADLLPGLLPRVRRYTPLQAEEFVAALTQSGSSSTDEGDLELVRRLWSANLTRTSRPDDHHALANLLGPQLLLGDSDGAKEPVVAALRTLMRSVGLLPAPEEKERQESKAWVDVETLLEEREFIGEDGLRLVLLDDQWRDGWGEVLCRAVGVDYHRDAKKQADDGPVRIGGNNGKIEVWAAASPAWLLAKLEESCADRRFRFSLIDGGEGGEEEGRRPEEILFLDLRLFSGRGVGAEAGYIGRLLTIAVRMTKERKLPWPGFVVGELEEIGEWTKNAAQDRDRKDPRYLKALTLLPRVLAQVDLSLPIVLFSSTGRRDIVKALDGYGTVITSFEKPRLDGATDQDTAARARDGFAAAFTRALEIAEGRRLCGTAAESRQGDGPEPLARPDGNHGGKPWIVELYLDETGIEFYTQNDSEVQTDQALLGQPKEGAPVTVGGLLAVFPPGRDPEEFNSRLLETISNTTSNTTASLWKGPIRNSIEKLLDEAHKLDNAPAFVARVSLTGSIPFDEPDSLNGNLHSLHVADNLYQDLARGVIEIALYHLARQRLPGDAVVEGRIFMATRHVPVEKGSKFQTSLFERYGLVAVGVGQNAAQSIRYINFDTVRPLARDIVRHYTLASFQPRIEWARAFNLNRAYVQGGATNPRGMHLLADAVLNPACGTGTNHIDAAGKNGFEAEYSDLLFLLLHGARLSVGGEPAEALTIGAEPLFRLRRNGEMSGAADVLARSLAESAGSMGGRDFLYFLDRRRSRRPDTSVPAVTATVTHRARGGDTLEDDSGTSYYVRRPSSFPALGIGDRATFLFRNDFVSNRRIVTRIEKIEPAAIWKDIAVGKRYDAVVLHVPGGKNFCVVKVEDSTGLLHGCTARKGEKIPVEVTSHDPARKIIYLSPPGLPREGEVRRGKVTEIGSYTVTVTLDNGGSGRIHISEVINGHVSNLSEYFAKDDRVEVIVLPGREHGLQLGLCRNLTKDLAGKYARYR